MRSAAALLMGLLITAACSRDASRIADHASDGDVSTGAWPAPPPAPAMIAHEEAALGSAATAARHAAVKQDSRPSVVRAEIREGSLRIRVASTDSAAARATAIAVELGGSTARRDMRHGQGGPRSATLQLRVPSDRFDHAMDRLASLGRVEHSSVNTIDVGDQLVDLRARLENARRLESRLLELLRTRTGTLQNVLAVERELARVREEIERFEAQLASLQDRVAMSTIVLDAYEPAPVVALSPAGSLIGESFRAAWRNFVLLVAAVIASLGVVIPVALAVVLVAVGVRRWRTRGRSSAPPPPAGGEMAAGGILGD